MDYSAKRLHYPCSTLSGFVKEFADWKNSHEEVECKRQGDLKVMAWCGMVDGRMLVVRWVVDENSRPHSGIRRCCNSMFGRRSGADPAVKITGSCKTATSDTTKLNINFLIKKIC